MSAASNTAEAGSSAAAQAAVTAALAVEVGMERPTGKAKGKGRDIPRPPPPRPSLSARSLEVSGKGAVTQSLSLAEEIASGHELRQKGSQQLHCTAMLMDGREVAVATASGAPVQSIRVAVGQSLGIDVNRVKLILGTKPIGQHDTVGKAGIAEGSVLNVIVLPPIYGRVAEQGLRVSDAMIAARIELHDALADRGRLANRPVF